MKCSSCGKEAVPGTAFCVYCGTRLGGAAAASVPQPEPAAPATTVQQVQPGNQQVVHRPSDSGGTLSTPISNQPLTETRGKNGREEILFGPEYAVVRMQMAHGERLIAEPGAMISMTPNIEVKSEFARGGFLKTLTRSFFGGESFFTTTYTAQGEAELILGRGQPGDMFVVELNNETIFVQSGAFVACDPEVSVNAKWAGVRSFFGGNGLFLLQVAGTGRVILATFGALHQISLGVGEDYRIDTGHVAAFHSSTMYTVESAGGFKAFLTSGEGLVCRFRGPGQVWLQTRNSREYTDWIDRFRPVRSTSDNDSFDD